MLVLKTEDMDLMGPFIPALAKIPSPFNPELPKVFIA